MSSPAKDFYSPKEIHFSRKTARWIIQHLGSLRGGSWPSDISNYTDIPIGKRTAGHQAAFVTPVECAAEITSRMERCGVDGLILLAIECWGESLDSLAKYFNLPIWRIRKKYKRALGYVASGPDRRWHTTKKRAGETYEQFKSRPKKTEKR